MRSAHSFGKPGKFCTGPPGSQNGSDVASVSSGTNVPGETSQDVLKSLIEVVNNLTTEVKVLKDEGKQLRALVQPASSASEAPPPRLQCRASAPSTRVTLPELRAMEDLRERVEQRVDLLGLVDSESEDSDTASSPGRRTATAQAASAPSARASTSGKLKSGKEAKLTSTVLFPQMWPHSFLCLTRAQREVKYEDLTLPEFVAGYTQILQSQDISPHESAARLPHLVSLMYFAQQFTWPAVLNFHGAVLLEIERGLLKWGDSFFHLESRTLYGNPIASRMIQRMLNDWHE